MTAMRLGNLSDLDKQKVFEFFPGNLKIAIYSFFIVLVSFVDWLIINYESLYTTRQSILSYLAILILSIKASYSAKK